MIIGHFSREDEAIILLPLRNDAGVEIEVSAVIDTGFTEYLALPRGIVQELNLLQTDERQVALGDGSITALATYKVEVIWDDHARVLTAFAVDGSALVGMKLLRDHLVTLELIDEGIVTIEPVA